MFSNEMMQSQKKEILFLVQYPENVSPAQRFRFELYKDLLRNNDFSVTTEPFIDEYGYCFIFKSGLFLRKSFIVLKGFFRRIKVLFNVKKYTYILNQKKKKIFI